MASDSQKVWAAHAADLHPISPVPVHPSSPIIVPALQDQADTLYEMASAGVVPKANEQSHQPQNAVHSDNNAATHTITPGISDSNLKEAVNGIAKKEGAAAVSIYNIQNSETRQSSPAEPERDVYIPNKLTYEFVLAPALSDKAHTAAFSNKTDLPASQASSHPELRDRPVVPNPLPNLRENSQPVFDTSVTAINAEGYQYLRQKLTADDTANTISNAHHSAIDVRPCNNSITTHIVDADAEATHSPDTASDIALPHNIALPPKPPIPGPNYNLLHPTAIQPMLSMPGSLQHSGMPFPLTNGTAHGDYSSMAKEMGSHCLVDVVAPTGDLLPNQNGVPESHSEMTNGTPPVNHQPSIPHSPQSWETFERDERNYISDARWDKFPDQSRLFLGNLPCERISKRDIFNKFRDYGRLAQISLKQSYGFVQYHTAAEGRCAKEALQGMVVGEKNINLEFSKEQRRDGEGGRAQRAKREGGRQNPANRVRRGGHRQNGQASPRRTNSRPQSAYEGNTRSRGFRESGYSSDRRRSRSPSYSSRDAYRHRSPSRHSRYTLPAVATLPRRYGPDVPEVQFLLLQTVNHDFVTWVQNLFIAQGLKVAIMFLEPHLTREVVIQNLVIEGVHAVVELDLNMQASGKIPVQIFNRSTGNQTVHYNGYEDLHPATAAELVAKAKSQTQMPPHSYQYSQPAAQSYAPPTPGHSMLPSYPPYQHVNQAPSVAVPDPRPNPLNPATGYPISGPANGQNGYSHAPLPDVHSVLRTLGSHPQEVNGHLPKQPNLAHGLAHPNKSQGTMITQQHVEDILAHFARHRK
ncbi:hypothetical protein F4808DRAFT_60413 [Astrocystis sublimbata]|nr:hypothetical protein F4808DRAFT_60413 [Astrocystis sublimbata]